MRGDGLLTAGRAGRSLWECSSTAPVKRENGRLKNNKTQGLRVPFLALAHRRHLILLPLVVAAADVARVALVLRPWAGPQSRNAIVVVLGAPWGRDTACRANPVGWVILWHNSDLSLNMQHRLIRPSSTGFNRVDRRVFPRVLTVRPGEITFCTRDAVAWIGSTAAALQAPVLGHRAGKLAVDVDSFDSQRSAASLGHPHRGCHRVNKGACDVRMPHLRGMGRLIHMAVNRRSKRQLANLVASERPWSLDWSSG